jgi:Ni/Co efflux regulator RcnB
MPVDDNALWRELDALGEHQVRVRLAQGAYRDQTRSLVEEWLRLQSYKRSLEQEPRREVHVDRRENTFVIVAATASIIAAVMATIAATAAVLSYFRSP